jgi:hypothetical protein
MQDHATEQELKERLSLIESMIAHALHPCNRVCQVCVNGRQYSLYLCWFDSHTAFGIIPNRDAECTSTKTGTQ